MSYYPASVTRLIKNLCKLPGVGEKTAERLAMHILKMSVGDAGSLAASITEVKEKVKLCNRCFSLSDGESCAVCDRPGRDQSLLCIVEQPAEVIAIEKSGAFNGHYHVLHGQLSPMDGIGPEDIRIPELMEKIRAGEIKEVIIATGTGVEGESTASYIAGLLEKYSVRVTRIATGVPIGGDLKYVDHVTLKRAMDTRHALSRS